MLDLIDTKGKKDIKSMTLEEVTAEMTALGEKSFRAKQLYDWLHVKLAESFDDMITLPSSNRNRYFLVPSIAEMRSPATCKAVRL